MIGLVDRAFEDDGSVVSRRESGAVLHDEDAIVERALSMALEGKILSRKGKCLDVTCDTLLMHGDNPASISAAERVRAALENAAPLSRRSHSRIPLRYWSAGFADCSRVR